MNKKYTFVNLDTTDWLKKKMEEEHNEATVILLRELGKYLKSLRVNYHLSHERKMECLQRSLLSVNNFLTYSFTFDTTGMALNPPLLHLPGSSLPISIYDSKLDSNDYKECIEIIKREITSHELYSSIVKNMVTIGLPEEERDESQFRVISKDRKITAVQIGLAVKCLQSSVPDNWLDHALKEYKIKYRSYSNQQGAAGERYKKVTYNSPATLTKCLEDYCGAFEVLTSDSKIKEQHKISAYSVWNDKTGGILSDDQNKIHLSTGHPSLIAVETEIKTKKQITYQKS